MYFTNTPALNSMEAIMKKTALRHTERRRSVSQIVSIHQERLRLQTLSLLQKKEGMHLDALSCVGNPAWMRHCSHWRSGKSRFQIYNRKDDAEMIFQNNRHKQIFEAERLSMRKPGKKTLAVLYLLTADHTLWIKTKHLFTPNGKVDLKSVRLGNVSTDSYALWKAVKEL